MASSSPRFEYYPDLPEWTPDVAAQFAELRARFDASLAMARTLDLSLLLETFCHAFQWVTPLNGLVLQHNGHTHQVRDAVGQVVSARLRLEGEKLGDINLYCAKARPAETQLDDWLALLTVPLRNAYRYRDALASSMRDTVTGAGNRAGLEMALAREVSLAQRHGQGVALLLLEVDHFRELAQRHGIGAGDVVLARLGRLLRALLRGSDQIFRHTDEQFAIVLGNSDERAAKIVAERIRAAVAALCINSGDSRLSVTVSAGLAYGSSGTAEIFLRADAALCAAKTAGHNCVRSY